MCWRERQISPLHESSVAQSNSCDNLSYVGATYQVAQFVPNRDSVGDLVGCPYILTFRVDSHYLLGTTSVPSVLPRFLCAEGFYD